MRKLTLTVAAVFACGLLSRPALLQQKGGEDETGRYEVVAGWPQPLASPGYALGSQGGVFAESPNRVILLNRGEIKLPEKLPNNFKYDLNGKMLTSWGTQGTFPGGIWNPHQFSVDSEGNLYIAEATGGRTQKFRPRPGADRSRLIGPPQALMPLSTK